MKTTWAVALCIFSLSISVRAQDADTPLQSIPAFLTASNIQASSVTEAGQMLQVIEALPTLSVTNQPRNGMAGTYWSAANLNFPPMPGNVQGLDAWPLDDTSNTFLLNDFEFEAEHSMMRMLDMGPPSPDDGDTNSSGGGSYTPGVVGIPYTNGLWLEMVSADPTANGLANLILHGTTNDVTYEILSREDLLSTNWVSETVILGETNQDWVPFSVAESSRTNAFFWARALIDTNGNGLPDYWEAEMGVSDPYGDPDGDGWNNLQEYQNGTDPNHFDTPPTPTGLTFAYSNSAAVISWNPSPGNVIGYRLDRFNPIEYTWYGSPVSTNQTGSFDLSSDTVNYVDFSPPIFTNYPDFYGEDPLASPPYYELTAIYSSTGPSQTGLNSGINSPKARINLYAPNGSANALLVRGSQGHLFLAVPAMPPSAVAIQLSRIGYSSGWAGGIGIDSWNKILTPYSVTNLIPISAFTNGIYEIPESWLPAYGDAYWNEWFASIVDANGRPGPSVNIYDGAYVVPFFDGREQIKQNLSFLLRAATSDGPWGFLWHCGFEQEYLAYQDTVLYGYENTAYNYPQDYAFAGYYEFLHGDNSFHGIGEFLPFINNYLFRNFACNISQVGATGYPRTGIEFPWTTFLDYPSTNLFLMPTNETSIPAVLSASDSQWIFHDADYNLFDDNWIMQPNVSNIFGLVNVSVKQVHKVTSNTWGTILTYPGQEVTNTAYSLYFEVAQPDLQTVDHYFANANSDPVPGFGSFSPTNPAPLMILPFGARSVIAGYAKQAILNGYSDMFAYLQLYFDKAYLCDDSGNVTTNEAGILSPYGEFLPTMPGTVAMVTMPENSDDTGPRGTNVVHVVKLQLDVNHDGIMDLSFAGPDNTAPDRPFRFWVNNDCDVPGFNGPDHDVDAPKSPDYAYSDPINGNGRPCVHSQRDLEDYARLWICGMPVLTNEDYQVTLSWGSVSSGNPAINLFQSAEINGGIAYLTNTAVAAAQASPATYIGSPNGSGAFAVPGLGASIGTVSPSQSYTFPSGVFTNSGTQYFLFEGAGIGKGELVMTISKDGQTVAETSQWIDLHDVKDFYEQACATNVTSGKPPSDLISDYHVIKTASLQLNETKQVVVFVHGINNTSFDYETTSATIFKRLYWSGYHGRFASFRWPCAYLPWNTPNPFLYNLGEFYAFKSATALKNYLNYLKNNRPDLAGYAIDLYAHSQGNVVASEAILQGAPFDNYILTQGAFPAHCYDTNAPFLQQLLDAETNSINAVQTPFYPVDGGYHGYCSSIHGNLIDFYNTNDFALASGTTLGLQTNWKEDQRAKKPEAFFFGPSYIYDPETAITTGYYTFSSYTVTDLQEIKALVARSRSAAVGAQGGLHGAISSSVDLFSSYGFGNTRSEHSAQFNRPIQTVKPYWDDVVRIFNPATP